MEIRRVKGQEVEQAIKLADKTFRNEGHSSMGEAFPQVFSKELQLSYGAFDGDKLVSFIGLVPSTIRIGEASLNVFSIGAVCTDEAYRKQGISTAILKEVYEYIDQAEASLLFVSGDRGLYKRNDCYHFGNVKKYTLDKDNKNDNADAINVRKGAEADKFQVNRLQSMKNVRYETSIWEWSMLLEAGGYASIFKMKQQLFVAEKDGVIKGYAVIGLPVGNSTYKQGIVTEWGGNPRAVHGILADLLKENIVPKIEVTVPWQEDLQDELNEYPYEDKQNGGTVYIVDAERLIDQALPYLKRDNSELDEKEIVQSIEKLKPEELVKLLFDCQSDNGGKETIFPLPLPNTEGMNYV